MTEQVKIKKRYRKIIVLLWILFLIPIFSLGTLFFMISNGSLGFMPSFEELENPRTNLATEIYTTDQQLLGKYFKENRSNVKYSDLSPYLVDALIATEDARFFEHSGIDFKSIGRVIFKTILGGKTTSGGGSTITQQLSKMLFPRQKFQSKKDIIIRKLKEWVIAIKLEKRYTKEEIITLYYNKFDFLNLAVGIKSASKVYFNTTPDSLKIEQAAMLVGMAKNPALFNPLRRPDTTLHRRNVVLNQMYKYKYITKIQYDSLKLLPLEINFQRVDHKLGVAPYFREYLRRQLTAKKPNRKNYYDIAQFNVDSLKWLRDPFYGWCNKNKKSDSSTYNIYRDGLKIYTTINYKMQVYAEQAVKEHLFNDLQIAFFKEQKNRKKAPFAWNVSQKQIDAMMNASMRRSDRYKKLLKQGLSKDSIKIIYTTVKFPMTIFSLNGEIDTLLTPMDSIRYYKYFLHAGFMSMNPHTGYVKAYVGGTNFKHFQFDHVTMGKRQVGSTFKPFLYTLAMQEGFSPCYKVPNVPVSFILPNGRTWTPRNADRTKHDGKMVTLRWGLANSVNSISA
ncbi:MAG: penicillin-binding protein, partial [Bacteroidetes bacterium]